MATAPRFAEIALPQPIPQLFSYTVPETLRETAQVGCRAFVPFRNRLVTGVITGLTSECPIPSLKAILDILDPAPILDRALLDLTRWVAEYYLCAWGEAIRAALPGGLLNEAEQTVTLARPCSPEQIAEVRRIAPQQALLLATIAEQGTVSIAHLKRRVTLPQLFAPLRALEAKGWVELRVGTPAADPGIKYETWVALCVPLPDASREVEQLAARAPRQASCVNLLVKHGGRLTTEQLRHLSQIDSRVIHDLVRKGLVETQEVEVIRDPYRAYSVPVPEPVVSTDEQHTALATIDRMIGTQQFSPVLLYGVTGSGKTHVYIRAIARTLEDGRDAIVLVPELALTPPAVRQFRAHFGDLVTVLHSGLSPGERYDAWRQTKAGRHRIVVGARSAVFAPVANLGLIVVDEEHEPSYKQFDDAPRYHARDVAIMRARAAGAVALLGSATPALETYTNALGGKFTLCRLSVRVDQRPLPGVDVVDMREEHKRGNWSIFSTPLRDRMHDRLTRQEQVILFLNRRGFSTFIQCRDCGHTLSCPHCSVTLTYHADSLLLRCHYCDHRMHAPDVCPQCRSLSIRFRGTGTQRVEDEVKRLFPEARVARMDVDTTTRKGSHYTIFERVLNQEVDILLGTQMVAKGFDFPYVTLVGVVSADTALNLPDFRASERTFQLLTQVAGRTGRSSRGGEVIIQTYALSHHSLVSARTHDYDAFYAREIEDRRELGYPPFGRLVGLLFQGADEEEVIAEARRFVTLLRETSTGLSILGPAPAVVARVRGQYRWQVIARCAHSRLLRDSVRDAWSRWEREANRERVRVSVDVDPVGA
ncbi:MAG: primosomal protein N' [Candidatus Latescibacteria bacterium]|nr:primosomal protein N' [Candidatus Latescibacterota bacterium]